MKVLVFTDSRGQHKPAGCNHLLFGERLCKHPDLNVDLYLCPFKWTTTIDFLGHFDQNTLQKYDWVVLYTGIVDWSPRKQSSAISDVYNNTAEINLNNFALNTCDYTKKIINNKKDLFDRIFGKTEMMQYLSNNFSVQYEGEFTVNMYSEEMALKSLIPRLKAIKNLIFINSNRFIPGWNGDYRRNRPINIYLSHLYSDIFSENLSENLIDLRQWCASDVKQMTCDNLHLTALGSDYIYKKICGTIGCMPLNDKSCKSDFDCEVTKLRTENRILRSGDSEIAYGKALENFKSSHRATHFHTALIAALRIGSKDCIEKLFKVAENLAPQLIPSTSVDSKYLKQFHFFFPQNVKERILEIANRPTLSANELSKLENKISNNAQLYNFINVRQDLVEARIRDEYVYIRHFPLQFPYNYISDYSENLQETFLPTTPKVKSATFIYPIKNRKKRVAVSLKSLARSISDFRKQSKHPGLNIDVIVVEDKSKDVLNSKDFSEFPFDIMHYLVNTGTSWTRSGLLNQGIKEAKGELLVFVDADVLFPDDFISRMALALQCLDIKKNVLAFNMFETHSHIKEDSQHSAGAPYSYMWSVLKKHAFSVGGFNEDYIGWGSEDRDFEHRVCSRHKLKVISTMNLEGHPYVFHLSHDARSGYECKSSNIEKLSSIRNATDENLLVAKPLINLEIIEKNRHIYKENITSVSPRLLNNSQLRKDKTLIIMGNGPSLGIIMNNPAMLQLLKKYDTFGLNAAYRAYDEYDFYPTYFGSFDFRVCESHAENFARLIEKNNPIKKFFFAKQSVFEEKTKSNSRFQRINFKLAPKGISTQKTMSVSFDDFNDCGSSGTNAVQAGYILGYRHFILLGVDCNYVELIDGVKDIDGIRYEVVGEIKNNPNYWFKGYQAKGDKFHKPNETGIQLVSWKKLDQLLAIGDGHVSNCSLVTKLNIFDVLPFDIRTKKFNNIFLVFSCHKYFERVEILRKRYSKCLHDDDLVLYVFGKSPRNYLSNDNILNLNVGDTYECLPQKVQEAFRFVVDNFDFNRIVKTDDDVFINFDKFYEVIYDGFEVDYFGRRTPTREGIKPSSSWHFGKVENESFYDALPFEIESPPSYWAGGGLYVLSRRAAICLATIFAHQLACYHLYEDFMVGDLLHRQGFKAVTSDELSGQKISSWCITNLNDIMSDNFARLKEVDFTSRSVSVHCGSYPPYYTVNGQKLSQIFSLLETSIKTVQIPNTNTN